MIRSFEELQSAGRENIEAAVASATALGSGLQTVATEVADYTRKSIEQGVATWEKVLAAKSFDKAIEIQQSYAKAAYEAHLGQVSKLGQLVASTAQAAYHPIEARLVVFTGKIVH
jgi:hypothetical protein